VRKLCVTAAALALTGVAAADGAFPDSVGLLLPQDRPNQLVVSSNFGLIWSDDNGAGWSYVCEPAMSAPYAFLYQVSRAPEDFFLVESLDGLSWSHDEGCTWTDAGFPQPGTVAQDAFPDPNDSTHVIASADWNGGATVSVFESHDGAATFGQPLFTSDAGTNIVGVEISRSAPGTYYAATSQASIVTGFVPGLARTQNGGTSWQTVDLSPAVGGQLVRIAAVDPLDADLVYLRVVNPNDPTLGALVSARDGGATVTLLFDGGIDAFFRRSDGTLLLSSKGTTYVSTDTGATFTPWGDHRRIRAFGERDGGLYVLTDCSALAATWDQGSTWTPLLLGFDQIAGPRACGNIASQCASDWAFVHPRIAHRVPCTDGVVCIADAGTSGGPDSGSTANGDGGNSDGGSGGRGGGCGCGQSPGWVSFALLIAIGLVRARRLTPLRK
jgi:hypothetical protein